MSRTITYDSQGNDITCMKGFDALEYPCKECDRENCKGREKYEDRTNQTEIQWNKRIQVQTILSLL